MNRQLVIAARTGNINAVRRLIAAGANPAFDNNDAIELAAGYGHLEVVRLLLQDERVDPSADNDKAIVLAAQGGYLEIVRLLLSDSRVNPGVSVNEPIRWAAMNGHLEVVRLLLQDDRVDPTADDNYAIRGAAENGHTEVVQLLATIPGMVVGAINYYLDKIDWTKLIALNKLARMTYAVPISANDPRINNEDLLVWGAMYGSVPLIKYLVEQWVDPTFANNTAIATANEFNQQAVIDYLLTLPGVHL